MARRREISKLVAFGFVALVILGAVVASVLLQGGSTTSADGVDAPASTTTASTSTSTTTTTTATLTAVDESTSTTRPFIAVDASASELVVTPVVLPDEIYVGSFASTDEGLLMTGSPRRPTPTILLSNDGVTWSEVATTIDSPIDFADETLGWRFVQHDDAPLALSATHSSGESVSDYKTITELFVSEDGVLWEHVDGYGSLGSDPHNGSVVFADSTAVVSSLEVSQESVRILLEDHTNLVLPDDRGICDLARTRPSDEQRSVSLSVCTARSSDNSLLLKDDRVIGSQTSEVIFDCLDAMAFSGYTQALAYSRLELDDAAPDLTFTDSIIANGEPLVLASGGLVLSDIGTIFERRPPECDEVIGGLGVRDPAVVLLDDSLTEARRVPLPEARTEAYVFNVGNEIVLADGRSLVTIHYDRTIWALDTQTEEWIGPLSSAEFEADPTGFDFSISVSDSTDRVFVRKASTLYVFDPFETIDGGFDLRETSWAFPEFDVPEDVFLPQINFADDDRLYFGNSEQTWLVEIPETEPTE